MSGGNWAGWGPYGIALTHPPAFEVYDTPHSYISHGTPPPTHNLSTEAARRSSIFTRSNFVRKRMLKIFTSLDTDSSNCLSRDELYSGVLLLHIELAKYVGPAACKPPSRAVVDELFVMFDE